MNEWINIKTLLAFIIGVMASAAVKSAVASAKSKV